jgi:uncharacterized BrkB/YihY/UPF0761 family membrane protein
VSRSDRRWYRRSCRVPLRRLLVETALKWNTDNVLRLSAALAYYAIFALSPLLVMGATAKSCRNQALQVCQE